MQAVWSLEPTAEPCWRRREEQGPWRRAGDELTDEQLDRRIADVDGLHLARLGRRQRDEQRVGGRGDTRHADAGAGSCRAQPLVAAVRHVFAPDARQLTDAQKCVEGEQHTDGVAEPVGAVSSELDGEQAGEVEGQGRVRARLGQSSPAGERGVRVR